MGAGIALHNEWGTVWGVRRCSSTTSPISQQVSDSLCLVSPLMHWLVYFDCGFWGHGLCFIRGPFSHPWPLSAEAV